MPDVTDPISASALAGRNGSSMVGHRPLENDGPTRTVQEKFDDLGTFPPDHRYSEDGDDKPSMDRALLALGAHSLLRTQPDGFPHYGFGKVTLTKGVLHSDGGFDYAGPLLGVDIIGDNTISSALTSSSTTGYGIKLEGYDLVGLRNFYLRNKARSGIPGSGDTSCGLLLKTGGGGTGGALTLENLFISGYHTAIKQDISNTVNGDKTFVVGSYFGARIVYDQGVNTQAIGWTFLNCGAATENGGTHFRLGGAGETLIANYTSNVNGSLIELPEGSGNGGKGFYPHPAKPNEQTGYFGQRVTVMSTKLEYDGWFLGGGDRFLLDARACQHLNLAPNQAGANADFVFREVSLASGTTWPRDDLNTVIQVGNNDSGTWKGSDAIRVKAEGGAIGGILKIGSNKTAADGFTSRWWSFRDMAHAPDPELVQFLGTGFHYMIEWRRNENVPMDQYRGGQGARVSIDSRKSFLIPIQGKYLIDTRDPDYQHPIGGRVGKEIEIPLPNTLRSSGQMGGIGFATVAQVGLAVYINNETGSHTTDVQISQHVGSFSSAPVANEVLTVEAGQRGLFYVHTKVVNISDGKLLVRITKPASGQFTEGRLVFDYFPYFGA
jgi:hypothetical protein